MGWFRLNRQEEKYWGRIRKGDTVEVIPQTFSPRVYRSRIERIGTRDFDLSLPQQGAAVMGGVVPPAMMMRVYTDFGIFSFKANVLSASRQIQGALTLSKPKSIIYTQLRQFYRLQVSLPVKYGAFEDLGFSDAAVPDIQATAGDISEGGILLVTARIHAPGTFLKLLINLTPEVWIPAVGVVRRQRKKDSDERMLTSVQFVRLSGKDRNTIKRFVLTHSIPLDNSKEIGNKSCET